jgi:TolB protein
MHLQKKTAMKPINLTIIVFVFVLSSCENNQLDFRPASTTSKIVFISQRTENSADWSLMVMNRDGSEQTKITHLTVRCEKPVPSHSGKRVLFTHYTANHVYELYAIGIDGSNLTLIDQGERYCGQPCWSNDDAQILYSINRNDTTDEKDIVLYDVSSGEKQTLTSDGDNSSAQFSNDKIVFCHQVDFNHCSIHTINNDDSQQQQILENASNPVISPDGTKMAYLSPAGNGSPQIFVANIDGSAPRQLTSSYSPRVWPGWPPDGNQQPAWTPDGRKIVYVSWEDEDPEIKIMYVDGSQKLKLTDNDKRDENPVVTHNGNYILFSSNRNIEMNSDIYVMSIEGNHQMSLTNYERADIYPVEIK